MDPSRGILRVVPSGAQRAIGGELRLPFRTPTRAVFDLRAEAYVVRSDTREVATGALASNERLGRLSGASWYVSIDWWACFIPGFEQLVTGEPGSMRPRSLDDARVPSPRNAIEVSVLASGIHASYKGMASSNSTAASNAAPGQITVYQFGAVAQYLIGANVRAALDWMIYVTPDSGNAAITPVVVPDNLPRATGPAGRGHTAHEVGISVAASL